MFALQTVCVLLGAYVVGALPSGYWLARAYGISDIRTFGSGNSGATNVGRALGPLSFIMVFAADCGKAFAYLAMLSIVHIQPFVLILAAGALLIGNLHSMFMQGTGGKGVATFMGILLALYPVIALCAFVTWLLAYGVIRVVGIASVVAVLAVPWYVVERGTWFEISLLTGLALWIVWRHRENIRIYYQV